MNSWNWAAAACKGTSHKRAGTRLQDAKTCFSIKCQYQDILVAIVSDGAGSAHYGGQGASIVCRSISVAIRNHFKLNDCIPTEEQFLEWIDHTRDNIYYAAKNREVSPREFAATLVCVVTDGLSTLNIHIGDGCAVFKDSKTRSWIALSWPDHGEYASTTSFITDEPIPKVQLTNYCESVDAVVVFSDGLERLALDFYEQIPHKNFFEGITKPLYKSHERGHSHALSKQLYSYLDSPRINERTDDDKTLIIATRL